MALNLTKGQRLNLNKENPGLKKVILELSWDVKEGVTADLDASCLCMKGDEGNEIILGDLDPASGVKDGVVWYGSRMKSSTGKPMFGNGAITHSGDEKTGASDGVDESITIQLDQVPAEVERILAVISIYNEPTAEKVTFGRVKNANVVLKNGDTNEKLYSFDLTEDGSQGTAIEMCRLYKKDGEWRFATLGEVVGTTQNGLEAIITKYQK